MHRAFFCQNIHKHDQHKNNHFIKLFKVIGETEMCEAHTVFKIKKNRTNWPE